MQHLLVFFIIQSLLLAAFFPIAGEAKLKELKNFPRERTFMWSEEAQGVAHDADHWYFSQVSTLWKIPAVHDLNQNFSSTDSDAGVLTATIPIHLQKLGYNHMGDIDYYQGNIYVPLEGGHPQKLLIFRASDLVLVAELDFPKWLKSAPWLAIHPATGILYISNFTPEEYEGLFRFKLEWSNQKLTLKPVGTLKLRSAENKKNKYVKIRRIQGGAFDLTRNLLLLASDTSTGGLFAFDIDSGKIVFHQPVHYSPGFPKYEELEGLDVWHHVPNPHVQGGIHLIMLDNDYGPDDLYFKHYNYQF